MDRIKFTINGEKYSVGSEVDSDVSVNDYLRNYVDLRGTKYMCKEGGCGACVVAVSAPDPVSGQLRTFSINSCLVSITSCDGWEITSIEGIGSRGKGYHPVQKALAEYNGTQCGYCSPGFVMSMYSLLKSNHYDLTQHEIENSFASNICRCTGYRPILDAFKSFAKDAPKPPKDLISDIEDLKICKDKEKCGDKCQGIDWCLVNKEDAAPQEIKKILLKDDRIWYRVYEIKDIFDVLEKENYQDYMLIAGNTGRGAYHIFAFPKILIDVAPIRELKIHYLDQNLVVGAGTTLTDLMTLFKSVSAEHEEFRYLIKLYEHLDLVAHIPVRNVGTIAGNLMVKHRVPTFSSDVFLLLECIGATLVIVDRYGAIEVTPEKFLPINMTGKVITQVKIPPLTPKHYQFVSFKVMPRSQNAHAEVNAAFLYQLDEHETVTSARLVFGGLSATFVHARQTEKFLVHKKLFSDNVLQAALKILEQELLVEEIPPQMSVAYRKKCALGLFYKGLLALAPKSYVNPRNRSGAVDLRKTRPLSEGKQEYETNPLIWPMTEPMPKVEALIQTSGEAFYLNDMPKQPREVWCAFVTADICTGEIESVDPSPALKIPGVVSFISVKDIPGLNTYTSPRLLAFMVQEEMFSDGRIMYYDMPIGLIVAETEAIANRAALLIKIKYSKNTTKPILTIEDAKERAPERVTLFFLRPPLSRGANTQYVIKDSHKIFYQYHFSMETLSALARRSDDGLDVYPSTHYLDGVQVSISDLLKVELNRIKLTVVRCGGSYGNRIRAANWPACGAALTTHLTNRPCRMVLSIQQNMRCIGKRLPCTVDFEVEVNSDGEIQYLEYQLYEDNGYVFSDQVIALAISATKSCYNDARWSMKFFNVTTDTASNTWMRAPGTLEGIVHTELIMEQISYEIGRDSLQVRQNNLNTVRNPEITEIIRTILRDSEYYKRREEVQKFNKNNRWKKRGIRISIMSWPVIVLSDYQVILTVYHADGTVDVKHGGIEVGQGINTRVVQVVAYTLNISIDKVRVKPNDTFSNPNTITTGGSRTTEAVCFGAIKCCQLLLDRLSAVRDTMTDPTWELLVETAFQRGINLQTSYHTTANDQDFYRISAAAVAEVELDILTGEHDVVRVDILEDTGTGVNPTLDVGQVEGAFVMGMGYWTSEEIKYDRMTGELLTDRTWYYYPPVSKDIPIDFRVKLLKNSFNLAFGVLGSKAVSEPATCLGVVAAFALREAIASSRQESGYPYNKWFNVDGPFTLEANVLSAMAKLEEFTFK